MPRQPISNMLLRTLTGAVYVALIVAGIVIHQYGFFVLFSIVTVLCLWEFYGLVNAQKRTRINLYYNCFGGWLMFAVSYLYASGLCPVTIFYVYFLYLVVLLITELYEKQLDPISHAAYIVLGQVYIALPVSLLNGIAFSLPAENAAEYRSIFVLALFVFIWINDTGAYLIGVNFGKHRLLERISPKKSWEGFFGGMLFTLASSSVFAYFYPALAVGQWAGLALAVSLFATWGDLIESLIKRTLSIKDSGTAIPGHGGFLDRFDSLLIAVYAVLFFLGVCV